MLYFKVKIKPGLGALSSSPDNPRRPCCPFLHLEQEDVGQILKKKHQQFLSSLFKTKTAPEQNTPGQDLMLAAIEASADYIEEESVVEQMFEMCSVTSERYIYF